MAGAAEPDAALAAAGDHAAFERLYREHVARIHSLARRMEGEETADDLTQEVFIRAWEKLPTFRGDAAFGSWLHRLAVNWILSRRETRRRRESKRVGPEGILEVAPARGARPGLEVDLERAMERLPERARRVFVLYDVEGYPHEEIAGLMGISIGTSKSQLHRARSLLRERLGGRAATETEARP
ncbi:MAG: RNA polymerase sigma factor [Gemmatimonadetes bacterium]|nr:RNA polymerase sigma factor [Gemmatimonadota bacterium]